MGVTIAYDLKWSANAKSVRKAMTNKIGVLNWFGVTINKNARQGILQAYISPKFTYCLPVWGHLNKMCTSSMNQALQRAARVVLHDKTAILNCDTNSSTGILPFDYMTQLRCAVRCNALLFNDNYISYMPPLLANNGSQIVTRNITSRRFNVPKHMLAASEVCFYHKAANFWNALYMNTACIVLQKHFINFLIEYILSELAKAGEN